MSSRTSVSLDRVENGENRPSFTEGFYGREAKKEAVFEREKLGVSVVMGSTAGHVPVLNSSVTADNGCLLDIGDQIIQVIVGAKVTIIPGIGCANVDRLRIVAENVCRASFFFFLL